VNSTKTKKTEIEELHKKACEAGQDFYLDPETGYQVMTELFLKKRGRCCESGCRHCPYGLKKGQNDV